MLEVDRLLPFCNGDPSMADRLIIKCLELVASDELSPFERLIKLADAFKHANNHVKSRLLCALNDHISAVSHQIDAIPLREQLVKRLLPIWECDDAYTKALACIIFVKFGVCESVECWYRLRQSSGGRGRCVVEREAALYCIKEFDRHLGGREEWREIMHGIIY